MSSKASKGYLRIPESQLRLERRKRVTSRTWHRNTMNLLLGKNVCGSCLRLEEDLIHWDTEFVWLRYDYNIESSLKNIMMSTFGSNIISIIPNANFCQKCIDIILSAHLLIFDLRNNCNHIQQKLTEISQQMKWTDYLDETGSLSESLNHKVNLDDKSTTDPNNDVSDAQTKNKVVTGIKKDVTNTMDKNVKTHKIVLNNESLKMKLLQEPDMHKFLIKKENLSPKMTEHKLPAGISVRKVRQSVDMSDFAPLDLLELNWAEEEDDSATPDNQILSNKLHSNEALIMNLMEKAKTVEKHIHFHENLQLKAKKYAEVPVTEQTLNDSLSVKLVKRSTTKENSSDNEDLIPQDLLELKWPEEQSCNATYNTKIPVKRLNFNEALTVKFIPSQKICKVTDSVDELAPHELLELNWNDEADQNINLARNHTDQKHSIDLTQWLQDQGMSTIKTKLYTHNNKIISNLNVFEATSEKNTLETKSNNEIAKTIVNKIQPGAAHDTLNSDTLHDLLDRNVILENSVIGSEPDNSSIRCGLCNLSFIQFESYWSHYKTHNISEAAKCYKCTAIFPVIELLVEHLLLKHSEDMAYCTLCYALFSQDRMAKHMSDYHGNKVELINAANSVQGLLVDEYCKKCNRHLANSANSPHICEIYLECTECQNDCVHEKYLSSYRDQITANRDVFKCPDCAYQYKTKQDIIRHANYAHLKRKSHLCKFCNARFSLLVDLANHSDTQHFTCRGCKEVFADKNNLDSHHCPKTLRKHLNCELCSEKFIALKCYVQHKDTALAAGDKCVFCNCSVPNKCNMARHMQLLHHVCLKTEKNTILFECTTCQADFKNDTDFKQHVCRFECRICTKRFSIKNVYEKHMEAHAGLTESLDCSLCGLQLLDKYALARHMLSHSDHEVCPICLNYIEKRILRKHIESHNNPQEPLKCPHCPFICNNQNQYEVHVNRFHLLSRPYECDSCKKCFYSKHRLREHIRLHSAEARPERCTLCSKKFARKTTLHKHMKLHSTGQLYNCDLCEKRYISTALLNEHRKSHRKHS